MDLPILAFDLNPVAGIEDKRYTAQSELGAKLPQGTADLFHGQISALNDREARAFELCCHVLCVIGGFLKGADL